MNLSEYRKRRVEAQGRDFASPFFRKWKPPKGGVSQWFADRGITPTLAEYREVAACAANGANPLGIH